jgi:peptidoglycan/LPS O-acetylase OafA/YrhL
MVVDTRRTSGLTYRPDVDGLRAIAVLAVIGFHASPRLVPGGYVGVDVFFVISGFLISGIIFSHLADGHFTFADFYARRIRRIFPALAVVLAGCWLVGWCVLVQDEYRELQKHLAAGATFLSNFLLLGETGYFDARAELKPLLHLWSLGVEEQFYLMWPPLLYLCWKRGLNLVTAILTIVVLSFALNVTLVGASAAAAFYLPLTRLWELLLGGLLAYVERFQAARVTSFVRRLMFESPDRVDDELIANVKAGTGVALLVVAVAALGKSSAFPGWWFGVPALHQLARTLGLEFGTAYPGWWAALPVVGTALLIWAGAGAWVNRAILSRRALVYVGLISYPLYLWHWPLLSFVRITESGNPSRNVRVGAIVLAFVLASLTYELIERPIRRTVSRRTPLRIAALAASLLLIASITFYSYRTNAFSSRTPQFAIAVDPPLRSPRHDADCNRRFPTAGEYCQVYAPDFDVTTALVGDSHAEHFLNGIGSYLQRRQQTVVHLGESGCPPLLDVERSALGAADTCREANNSVLTFVASSAALSTVVLSFRGAADVSGTLFGDPAAERRIAFKAAGTTLSPAESMRTALDRTIDFLLARGKTVWLLLQVPELGFPMDQCAGRPVSFSSHVRTPCAVPKDDVVQRQAEYRRVVDDVKKSHPALHVFDPMPTLCDNRWCYGEMDHVLMYVDDNHLSRAGSLLFASKFSF